jgi:pyruvate, water dikinase
MKFIAWFNELSKDDISLAGGKGANLGEMTRANIPVPPGFVITADAYFTFIKEAKLEEELRQLLNPLDVEDTGKLRETSDKIKQKLSNAPMPEAIAREIKQAYRQMGDVLVAVRSSATAEDLPEASFAGQQRTFLNVQGEDEVLAAVQGCWASLFEPRAIFYRQQGEFNHLSVGLAVPVQQMIQSEVSGVMFTVDPLTNDRGKVIIEAAYGLGEAIVSGEVTPDQYTVDKVSLAVIGRRIAKQEWQIVRNQQAHSMEEGNTRVIILPWEQSKQKLSDEDIVVLAELGKRLENLYQFPQDIEWAKEDNKLFIVQTRPVTTLAVKEQKLAEIKAEPLFTGEAASLGVASGTVRIISDPSQVGKVRKGDVLVAEMTSPDFAPALNRAVAIITDRGGRTSHAAIVSRELGIPCVVGTEKATKVLTDGQEVTVDGSRGRIYSGRVIERIVHVSSSMVRKLKTKTKVYVNLAQPSRAIKIAERDVDGVGLLRAEFIIAQIGEHPRLMLQEKREDKFITELAQGINSFARAFYPRPVVYRTTDFRTNEYRNLRGGEEYEGIEENPMLGYRGCSRYVQELDILKLEIEAIKKVRENHNNLWVMIPFVRMPSEMAMVKQVFEAEGLTSSQDFKLWMMVEVPSNILLIDRFLDVGIDGVSIGSNDLTQLTLGIDRDNSKLASLFDERNEAVMQSMERVITACRSKGVTSSICGQAPSFYPEVTEKLVRWGITSVSVSPDMIDKTREVVAAVEAKLGL